MYTYLDRGIEILSVFSSMYIYTKEEKQRAKKKVEESNKRSERETERERKNEISSLSLAFFCQACMFWWDWWWDVCISLRRNTNGKKMKSERARNQKNNTFSKNKLGVERNIVTCGFCSWMYKRKKNVWLNSFEQNPRHLDLSFKWRKERYLNWIYLNWYMNINT